jgi:RNA polymerase sigma-70 factor (ECF subfamily)
MAGAATVSDIAGALGMQEATLVDELKAGSEEAYARLIQQYHQPVYSLVYRMLNDSADAADTTQEVFLKVFHGMKNFHGESSLKTWIYRIALHEASNRRRWWRRHKSREVALEPPAGENTQAGLEQTLADEAASPLACAMQQELRARVEQELQQVSEPYRSTVILRDIEELSYEEIAEIMQTTLGTVKSRLTRGREALRKRLESYMQQLTGNAAPARREPERAGYAATGQNEIEVLG